MIAWPRFALGLALTAVAGAIDAVSFSRFGAVYACFMSGNTVQLGLHATSLDWAVFGYFALLVALFMAGACLGGIVAVKSGGWLVQILLAFELALVALALLLDLRFGSPLLSTAPLALAMGAQNQLVVLVRGANPATTFVTGTAFRLGDAVAQRLLGRDPGGAWRFHLAVWLSFGVGAALGAWSYLRLGEFALAPVAATVGALATVTSLAPLASRSEEAGRG